jgi:hypothetical protein
LWTHRPHFAAVAHLVERHLAKVEVASSSLVGRSKKTLQIAGSFYFFAIFSYFFIVQTVFDCIFITDALFLGQKLEIELRKRNRR